MAFSWLCFMCGIAYDFLYSSTNVRSPWNSWMGRFALSRCMSARVRNRAKLTTVQFRPILAPRVTLPGVELQKNFALKSCTIFLVIFNPDESLCKSIWTSLIRIILYDLYKTIVHNLWTINFSNIY